MKIKTKPFVLGALLTTCSLAIVTSITSTFAWYSYNTKNGMAFSGVATGKTESLQVRLSGEEEWGTSIDKDDLLEYSDSQGFAKDYLSPVSQAMGIGSTGNAAALGNDAAKYGFYGAPTALTPKSSQNNVKSDGKYIFFRASIDFRCVNPVWQEGDENHFYAKDIYISFMEARATSEGKDITKGLRVHINQGTSNYLIAPGYTDDSNTPLTGSLNLLGSDEEGAVDQGIRTSGEAGSIDATYRTYIPGYDEPEDLETVIYGNKTDAKEYYIGSTNTVSTFTEGKATSKKVCVGQTREDGKAISVNLTIWLEGWDPAVVNSNYGATFDLGLQFEVETL